MAKIPPNIMSQLVAMDQASKANARILIDTAMKQIEASSSDASTMEIIQVTSTFVACLGYTVGVLTEFDEEMAVKVFAKINEDLAEYARIVYPNIHKNEKPEGDWEPA